MTRMLIPRPVRKEADDSAEGRRLNRLSLLGRHVPARAPTAIFSFVVASLLWQPSMEVLFALADFQGASLYVMPCTAM